jgi:hypothetical protein
MMVNVPDGACMGGNQVSMALLGGSRVGGGRGGGVVVVCMCVCLAQLTCEALIAVRS